MAARQFPPNGLVLGTSLSPLPLQHVILNASEQTAHVSVFGKTGVGKSTLLKSVFVQAINRGQGMALLEPHHDLSFGILRYLIHAGYFAHPASFERLVYIDWGNGSYVPFNVLRSSTPPTTTALQVLEAYLRVFTELRTAAAFQTLFLSAVVTLIANSLPITYLYQLLSDAAFRQRCLTRVTDPLIHQTFQNYATRGGELQKQLIGSALRRAFLTTFHPVARLTLGQPENWLDQRTLMDRGVCLIHNLGHIADPETRTLIAALLMVQLEHAALSRVDVPPETRAAYTVLVDEWPAFCAQEETMGNLLAQMRKFNVRLWLAAQSTSQIPSSRLAGALENCGVQIVFGVGYETAVHLSRHLGNLDRYLLPYDPAGQASTALEELQNLPPQVAYIKRGTQPAVKTRTLTVPDNGPPRGELERVLSTYAQRFQRSQAEAEAAAARLLQTAAHPTPLPADAAHSALSSADPVTASVGGTVATGGASATGQVVAPPAAGHQAVPVQRRARPRS